ncbi:transglycosylase SLT domain-containing protein [Streptomyces nanshensis]|uniref:Transglycosylase SLT domain-containing protein n=1 Tax=Streptomyces nanshensis TaxID=518642 RepID=A0A1E7LD34_9ACTN|nr:transglycosylase SLT domain-containing protein [Streptomyces nanshensis]OEV14064.1 hypothetical protein AN218_00905 [Streptomyces nanshensis]
MSIETATTRGQAGRALAATALAVSISLSTGSSPATAAQPADHHPAPAATADTAPARTGMVRGVTMTSRSELTARPALSDAAKAERTKPETEALNEAQADAITKARDEAHKNATPTYPNNLDGWIREALAIMHKEGIPGSYDGIKRNIIRESGGDPNAVNNWDINAQNGDPSRGLLQTTGKTFDHWHVQGTSTDITDPVGNIAAACNYAADEYGSIDNVSSAY